MVREHMLGRGRSGLQVGSDKREHTQNQFGKNSIQCSVLNNTYLQIL